MTFDTELNAALERVGGRGLWRPVEMVRRLLASRAPETMPNTDGWDHLADALLRFDFTGKTVADLGANIGHYAFFAALRGAKEVAAFDFGEDIVRIGGLLAAEYGVDNVRFQQVDFSHVTPHEIFDVSMMLDIMGNNKIRKGRVKPLLDAMLAWTRKEAITNLRPVYDVQSQAGVAPEELLDHYPAQYVRNGQFYMWEYVWSVYAKDWDISRLSTADEAARADKPALLFLKRD